MNKLTAKKILLLIIILSFISSSFLFAEGEELALKIAVIGPGDELYFWWGHIALMIDDSDDDRSRFYDYGLFSFESENFFYNFAIGRLIYSCGYTPSEFSLKGYVRDNRDITIYTLDVLPEKRAEVRNFAQVNVLPENRDYSYHHFKDNCSTRIRDIIDLATDGQFFEEYGHKQGRYTFRQHVRRHTWFSPSVDWLLNFWMGQVIDTPTTVWQEMFLPSEVGKCIEDFWYTDSNGERRKLVSSVEIVYKSHDRPAVLDVPRKQWPRELFFSIVLSAIFCFFSLLQIKNHPAGRILAGSSMSLAGLVFGLAGLLLYFLNIFTNHDYTYQNYNMLFGTPLLLAAVPYGICYAITKDSEKLLFYNLVLRLLWILVILGILVSMVIKLFPPFYQKNLTDQMLFLPIALVFVFHPAGLKEVTQKYLKRIIFNRRKNENT
jgi:hypothetical protein